MGIFWNLAPLAIKVLTERIVLGKTKGTFRDAEIEWKIRNDPHWAVSSTLSSSVIVAAITDNSSSGQSTRVFRQTGCESRNLLPACGTASDKSTCFTAQLSVKQNREWKSGASYSPRK